MPDAAPDPPGSGRHARLARLPQPRPLCDHRFAHPVEREFARVLDDLRVPWLYEPHTFVLERRPDGGIARAFTPDFYLPEQDFYLEVTVARRCLTGAKRKKVERARTLHGIDVEIVFRADFERLANRWHLHHLGRAVDQAPPTGPSGR